MGISDLNEHNIFITYYFETIWKNMVKTFSEFFPKKDNDTGMMTLLPGISVIYPDVLVSWYQDTMIIFHDSMMIYVML